MPKDRLALQNGTLKQVTDQNTYIKVDGNYVIPDSDPYTLYVGASPSAGNSRYMTLPAAANHPGRRITIMKLGYYTGESALRILSSGGNVGGRSEQRMYMDGSHILVRSDGTNWIVEELFESGIATLYLRGMGAGSQDYKITRNMNHFQFTMQGDHVNSATSSSVAYLSYRSGGQDWYYGWRPVSQRSMSSVVRGRDQGASTTYDAAFINFNNTAYPAAVNNTIYYGFGINSFSSGGPYEKGIETSTFCYVSDNIIQ